MRRMYSEKELTTIINQVVGEYIEAGALDESIADAVDAYLVEHPVDITALENQTIAPATVNATTKLDAPVVTGDRIVERMTGYSFSKVSSDSSKTMEYIYVGAVKNGNKLTLAIALNITRLADFASGFSIGTFTIPAEVGVELYTSTVGTYSLLDIKPVNISKDGINIKQVACQFTKISSTSIGFTLIGSSDLNTKLTLNDKYYLRLEVTFLLSSNLAS